MTSERILSLVIRWLVLALAVWVAAEIVPGIHVSGWQSTLAVALILGLLNLYIRPVLTFFTLPITLITLGLFIIVINALLLGLTDWITGLIGGIDFEVDGFWAAILGALVISLVSLIVSRFVDADRIARNLSGGRF